MNPFGIRATYGADFPMMDSVCGGPAAHGEGLRLLFLRVGFRSSDKQNNKQTTTNHHKKMKFFLKLTMAIIIGVVAIAMQSCGSHPEIDIEKISDYASKIDSLEDNYHITADDANDVVGQFQAVVDKVEEYGKDNVWIELDKKYPGKSGVIQFFVLGMQGIAQKQKHNLENNDGLVWADVKKLPFTSSQVNEIIKQAERLESLR